MRVGGQNMDAAFVEHFFRPIFRAPTEGAGEGPRGDLHPHARPGEILEDSVAGIDPSQPLGMRQDWHIAGDKNTKKELFDLGGRDVVRRLHENITGVGQRENVPRLQARDEIMDDVGVRAAHEPQRQAFLVQSLLKLFDGRANLRTAVVKQARKDVRGAGHDFHVVGDEGARHR